MGSQNVVEDVRIDNTEITIYGGCSSSGKCPLGTGEVRKLAVGMLKEGNED